MLIFFHFFFVFDPYFSFLIYILLFIQMITFFFFLVNFALNSGNNGEFLFVETQIFQS
jgi:hypothetical protein